MTSSVPPRVTVLVTVYNDERHVGEALASILAQTFADFELLVVDDGSTDGTPAVLASFAARDPRVRVIRQDNAGTTAAANRGLELARGEYVARLDSDDVSLPHRLQREVDFLDAHPDVALVGGGSLLIDLAGNVIGRRNVATRFPGVALRSRCIYQQSDVMFRRDVVRRLGGYRAKIRNCQDYDLWLRVSEVSRVAKLTDVLGHWRVNPGGYTLARADEQAVESALVRRLARERRAHGTDSYDRYEPPPPPPHRRPLPEAAYLAWTAGVMLQDGRRTDARALAARSRALAPSRRATLVWLASFLPAPLVRLGMSARETFLNYRHAL